MEDQVDRLAVGTGKTAGAVACVMRSAEAATIFAYAAMAACRRVAEEQV